jgi:hypothetical protein
MVIIVVGVGSVRGWRSTWLGAGGGLAVLAVLVLAAGTALTAVPIGGVRLGGRGQPDRAVSLLDHRAPLGRVWPLGLGRQQPLGPGSLSGEQRPCVRLIRPRLSRSPGEPDRVGDPRFPIRDRDTNLCG